MVLFLRSYHDVICINIHISNDSDFTTKPSVIHLFVYSPPACPLDMVQMCHVVDENLPGFSLSPSQW